MWHSSWGSILDEGAKEDECKNTKQRIITSPVGPAGKDGDMGWISVHNRPVLLEIE